MRSVPCTLLVAVLMGGLWAGRAAAQDPDTPSTRTALAHLRAGASARGEGALPLVVTGASRSGRSGLTYVYVRPEVDGVEVADDPVVVVVDARGAVVHQTGEIGPTAPVDPGGEVLGPAEAARAAADAVGLRITGPVAGGRRGGRSGEVPLTAAGLGEGSAARLVYHRTEEGALRLAYEVALLPPDPREWWAVRVDADTGAELWRHSLAVTEPPVAGAAAASSGELIQPGVGPAPTRGATDGASYLVYGAPLASPYEATAAPPADGRALAVDPADPAASPFGWHDTDGRPGAEYTTTRGNNADAFSDRDNDALPDADLVPDGGHGLTFLPPLNLTAEPSSYTAAAVTNAFYWANYAHDVLYAYGFDEDAGNFQENGYGRGGEHNDPVRVFVQSGGGTNGAVMSVSGDGTRANMVLQEWTAASPRRDAALDNSVVVHEYVHGLTIRLTGAGEGFGCLSATVQEQMGEGWSDWYALMLTMKPGDTRTSPRAIGAYAYGQGAEGLGLRPSFYSTDPAVNRYTYRDTPELAVPHGVGFVWATALWGMTWDLVDAYGFDPDLSDAGGWAGNQVALSLVTEALRLTPCRPGFVDARDAVLAADRLLYGGRHLDLLWRAFARRGLGASARQGSSSTNGDNVGAFDLPSPTPPDDVPPESPLESPPGSVDLRHARPNPVGRTTTIAFGLPSDAPVRLAVYDVRGREVAVLAEGAREAGWHDAVWTPESAAGVYIVRLVAEGEVRALPVVVR